MSLYDNEENAIVNNDNDVSETPSNLVNNNLGLETSQEELDKKLQYKRDGNVNESKLSPNPAGFGFIKQLFVTPENTATNGEPNLPGEPNVLYLVQVINDGVLIGFRKYKWTPSDGFVQFGASPDLKLKDSPRETPTRVENEPKKNLAQVFNGDVAVNGDLFVNGQKVQGSADPLTPSEVVDIVNEGIEGGDIEVGTEVVANPTLAGTEDALTGLQVGNTKYALGGGSGTKLYLCKKTYSRINNANLINGYLHVSLYSSKPLTEDEFVSKYTDWDIRVRYQYGTDTVNNEKVCGRQLNTISSVTKTSLTAFFNCAKIVDGALANAVTNNVIMSSDDYECIEL